MIYVEAIEQIRKADCRLNELYHITQSHMPYLLSV
jgi:hypothetical protein